MSQKLPPSRTAPQFVIRFPDEDMRDRIRKEAEKNGRSMNAEIISRLELTLDPNQSSMGLLGSPIHDVFNSRSRDLHKAELEEIATKAAEKAIEKNQNHQQHLLAQEYIKLLREMMEKDPSYRPMANYPWSEDLYQSFKSEEGNQSKTPSIPGVNDPKKGLGSPRKK